MLKPEVAVVIPLYSTELSQEEESSLKQCIDVLGKYTMILICPTNLDLHEWEYNDNFEVQYFDTRFFESASTYSHLLLSKHFYKAFSTYEHILIYQLDAWVFRDELEIWIEKDYDYIGAPWFTYGTTNHRDGELCAVGNGGFSLRNVNQHLAVLQSRKNILNYKQLWFKHYTYSNNQWLIALFKTSIQLLGIRNNISHFLRLFTLNEDFFWGIEVPKINPGFKVAPINIAIKFSFECDPEYLYKVNQNQLPFGCHAWQKWGNSFWEQHINNKNE